LHIFVILMYFIKIQYLNTYKKKSLAKLTLIQVLYL